MFNPYTALRQEELEDNLLLRERELFLEKERRRIEALEFEVIIREMEEKSPREYCSGCENDVDFDDIAIFSADGQNFCRACEESGKVQS